MPWLKIDEGMTEHPKVVGLAPLAFRALIESWCYCSRNLTDGLVPGAVARRWANATCIKQLLDAGLWERQGADYLVHDYLSYNPSRAEVQEQRAQAQAIRSAGGRARAQQAQRTGGRFTSSAPADEPAAAPAEHQQAAGSAAPAGNQHRSDPDPTPIRSEEPTAPDQNPPTPRKRGTVVDGDFKQVMYERFPSRTPERIDAEIADALGHTAAKKRTDLQAYVRNWLTRAFEEPRGAAPTPIRQAAGYLKPVPAGAYEHLIHRGYE